MSTLIALSSTGLDRQTFNAGIVLFSIRFPLSLAVESVRLPHTSSTLLTPCPPTTPTTVPNSTELQLPTHHNNTRILTTHTPSKPPCVLAAAATTTTTDTPGPAGASLRLHDSPPTTHLPDTVFGLRRSARLVRMDNSSGFV